MPSYDRQTIVIAANPGDEEFPWAVILQDRITMFDIKYLSFEGEAKGVTDWTADNYWYPKMWIEVIGFLEISGVSAKIRSRKD